MTARREQTMLIVGDVFVLREDPPSVFKHVKDLMRSADFMLGNLEGSVCDVGKAVDKLGSEAWKADSHQLSAIKAAGFHAMNVANNHMMDFGHEAMLATIDNLDGIGVKHCGGGRNFAEAHAPAIVERDGCKVALLGYTCVFMDKWAAGPHSAGLAVVGARTAYEPPKRVFETPGSPPIIRTWAIAEHKAQLANDIAAARENADIVVCTFHWGVSSGFRNVTEYQIELGRFAVDSGADLVFGHHPHLLQGIEVHNARAIFYSLGNFTFARHRPHKGHEFQTGMIRCRIRDKKISSVDFLPARCDEHLEPRVLDLREGRDVVDLIRARSEEFGTDLIEAGDCLEIIREPGHAEVSKAA
jgi:poly-gamma-glutamate capsule biosynthesis protein CapA/YwtB (metallophosphatase superfamily)